MTRRPLLSHSRIEVGRRLRTKRQALGLRTRDVHRATGIGESTWSQYENGHRYPDVMQILPFADSFGISLDWIYRGIIAALPYGLAQRIMAAQQREAGPPDEDAAEPPKP